MIGNLVFKKISCSRFLEEKLSSSMLDQYTRIGDIQTMENLIATLNNRLDSFHSVWSLWDRYIIEWETAG